MSSTHPRELSIFALTVDKQQVLLKVATDPAKLAFSVTPGNTLVPTFAALSGLLIGYEAGSINGLIRSENFIEAIENRTSYVLGDSHLALILSILFCGAFFGSIVGGYWAEAFGRRWTIIQGSCLYSIGVIIQMMIGVGRSNALGVIVAGRFIAGSGIGAISTGTVLYMSETCSHRFRGACIAVFEWCITIGYLAATVIVYALEEYDNPSVYRVLLGLQFVWPSMVAIALYIMPESPRYLVHIGKLEEAYQSFAKLRRVDPKTSEIQYELSEIFLDSRRQATRSPDFAKWARSCGSALGRCSLKRSTELLVHPLFVGIVTQTMREWSGITFITHFTTRLLESSNALSDPLLISLVLSIVSVCSTPLSIWTIDRFGRRRLLVVGTCGMLVSHFINAIVGVTSGIDTGYQGRFGWMPNSNRAVNAQIAMISTYVFFYSASWGSASWVVVGEIFQPAKRSRAVGWSLSAQWLWKILITVGAAYVTGSDHASHQSSVFFLWGGLCFPMLFFVYFFVPDAKSLTLEQANLMLESKGPRGFWKPQTVASCG